MAVKTAEIKNKGPQFPYDPINNPSGYGRINTEAPKASVPEQTTSPAAPAGTTTSKYGPEYYAAIRNKILNEATSPEWSQSSQTLRSQLAGKGVLSGSAYDNAMTERLSNLGHSADTAVAEAMIQQPENEKADLAQQKSDLQSKLALLDTYKNDKTSSGYAQYWDTYNQLARLYGTSTTTTPTEGTTTPTETSIGPAPGTENTSKAEYITASSAASQVASGLDKWIAASDLNSDDAAYTDYKQEYQTLVNKLQGFADAGLALNADDLATFNKWTAAYKELLAGGNTTAKLGPGDTDKLWANIKFKYGLGGAAVPDTSTPFTGPSTPYTRLFYRILRGK